MTSLPLLMDATRRGMRIDRLFAQQWRAKLQADIEATAKTWRYLHVNPMSSRQVSKWLYGELGLPPQYGKKGGWSADETALNLCLDAATQEQADDILVLLRLRKLSKDLSTYAIDADRVYPQFLPQDKEEKDEEKGQGAGTGRIQPRRPNVANQPDEARRLFIPDHGMLLAYLDWHSAEARIEAALSGDAALTAAIEGDLHGVLEHELKLDRTRAKNVFYGTGRGAGPRKLVTTLRAKGFRTTEREMSDAQARLFNAFPDWRRAQLMEETLAKSSRVIRNPFGRRWHIYHPSVARKAWARKIQSSVADMLWRVLSRWPGEAQLLTPVHDAVLIQIVNPEEAYAVQTAMQQEFPEIAPGFRVPVKVTIGQPGQSWGELE